MSYRYNFLGLFCFKLNFTSCYQTIFTNGSKDGDTAGSACVTPSDRYKCRLSDVLPLFFSGDQSY